jgi:hypothetical protein
MFSKLPKTVGLKSVFRACLGRLAGTTENAVVLVESGRVVDFDQAKGVDKFEQLPKFWHARGLNRTINYIAPIDQIRNADASRDGGEWVVVKRIYPLSDLGIKVGCFVSVVQISFHAVNSILFEGMWRHILRHPIRTWRFCVEYAPAALRAGVFLPAVQRVVTAFFCMLLLVSPALLAALGLVKD